MNLLEFRGFMEQQFSEIERAAISAKAAETVPSAMKNLYKELDDDQRALADQVISGWVMSTHGGKRFVALSLIEDFMIRTAMPQLRALEASCKNRLKARQKLSDDPAAPYDLAKVRRVISRLETS